MNQETLEGEVFPRLAARLLREGEVYVEMELASLFARYLMNRQRSLWMATEQDTDVTEDLRARFFVRPL